LRGSNSKTVVRCTDHRARPSHADQLHVDIWWRGKNIACDAGTYLYGGEGVWRNGLAHTAVHNTVTIDHQDQMKRVSRFTWTNWSQGKVIQQNSSDGIQVWQGEHNGYQKLPDPVIHRRTVLMLDRDRWLVVDHLNGKRAHHYSLHWLLNDFPYTQKENSVCLWPETEKYQIRMGLKEGESAFSVVRGDPKSTRGWRSQYYGHKEPAISAMLETERARVCFWTYFGFESDSLTLKGQMLDLVTQDSRIQFDLVELSSKENLFLYAIKKKQPQNAQ
jgi:asparagine synthase (glutamine-hydrolysing)